VKSITDSKKFYEQANKGKREPLRTLKEMADEFGLSPQALRMFMHHHDGPDMALDSRGCSVRGTWYSPTEMRRWWRGLTKEAK